MMPGIAQQRGNGTIRPMGGNGSGGRVGVIDLSTCTTLTAEFRLAVPPEVLVLYSRVRLPGGEVSIESLDRMVTSRRLEEAACELSDAGVAAITFACTSGSLLHGAGYDDRLRERMREATGVESTTTATSVVEALRHLGAESLSVGTPYVQAIDERERVFLLDWGFGVERIVGLGKHYDREIGALTADEVRALARSAYVPGCDVLFLSCTNLPALPLVAELEQELGTTVVTSNSATIWNLARVAGLEMRFAPSLGRLLAGAP
jgi:maleate isomerase